MSPPVKQSTIYYISKHRLLQKKAACVSILLLLCTISPHTYAQPSSNLKGSIGLITVPTARMDKTGTVRAGISYSDPYASAFMGMQISDYLYMNLKQTAESSSLNDEITSFYPSLDLKLRLRDEGTYIPALSFGMDSALTDKRMSGEYLAATKKFGPLDLTAGIGWGRYATAEHFINPFHAFGNHFKNNRNLNSDEPAGPEHWFTGEHIGFFGGIEYITPIEGLSLKADYGADRYSFEVSQLGFNKPPPWSMGLSYTPYDWVNASIGTAGLEKITAQITFQTNFRELSVSHKKERELPLLNKKRFDPPSKESLNIIAQKDGLLLYDTAIPPTPEHKFIRRQLEINDFEPLPDQAGHAAIHMANFSAPSVETLKIIPTYRGLVGPEISVQRQELEAYHHNKQGSAEELWHSTAIHNAPDNLKKSPYLKPEDTFHFTLENHTSLIEEDSGLLNRTSLIASTSVWQFFGLLNANTSLRLNIVDNLDEIALLRPLPALPVRSDVQFFTDDLITLDRSTLSFNTNLNHNTYLSLSAGYLEEFYAGAGGEILYRPHDKRYAIGAEAWFVNRRDPFTSLNTGFSGDGLLTGHVNAWYHWPQSDLVMQASAGRYLAEDFGGSLSIEKSFKNGVKLSTYATLTDQKDQTLLGGTSNIFHGFSISVPLGHIPKIPGGSRIVQKIEPFGRDQGQRIDKAAPLYDLTERFSGHHLSQHWNGFLK